MSTVENITSLKNEHYLAHITHLGEQQQVHAIEDIYNQEGVKLIAKGVAIDRRFLNALLKHKLLKPIDFSISIAHPLSHGQLKKYTIEAINNSPYLQAFLPNLFGLSAIISYIGHVTLNTVLVNKLTVMRKRLPLQFEHSLIVAFVCLFLGKICMVSDSDMKLLANIGLFHDIGVVHIDPILLDPAKDLDIQQWRQMYTHPLIGFLILNEQSELNPLINNAILEHHERMDGSGYPRNLMGDNISYLGRIIAVAETAIGICQKDSCDHLATVLKSNINTLDKDIIQTLSHVLYEASLKNVNNPHLQANYRLSSENLKSTQEMAKIINTIFSYWYKHKENINSEASQLLSDRLEIIRRSLIQAGVSPVDTLNQLNPYEADPIISTEVSSLLRETMFQLQRILDEVERRKPGNNEYATLAKKWLEFTEAQLCLYNNRHKKLI